MDVIYHSAYTKLLCWDVASWERSRLQELSLFWPEPLGILCVSVAVNGVHKNIIIM